MKMILSDGNKEFNCEVVARWSHNGNDYIAYAEENNDTDMIISKCSLVGDKLSIYDITDDNEWKYVNDFLDHYLYEVGDNVE